MSYHVLTKTQQSETAERVRLDIQRLTSVPDSQPHHRLLRPPFGYTAPHSVPYRNMPYRIVLHRTVQCLTIPYHAIPHRTCTESYHVLYRTIPYRIVLYRTAPYRAMQIRYDIIALKRSVPLNTLHFCVISYRTMPTCTAYNTDRIICHIKQYHSVPRRIMPYNTVPYHTIPFNTAVSQYPQCGGIVLHHTMLRRSIQHCSIPYQTIRNTKCAVSYRTIWYRPTPYHTLPYHTVRYTRHERRKQRSS